MFVYLWRQYKVMFMIIDFGLRQFRVFNLYHLWNLHKCLNLTQPHLPQPEGRMCLIKAFMIIHGMLEQLCAQEQNIVRTQWMLVIVITTTIVIINRAKYYQRFPKCAIGDKKESFRKHKEMGWTGDNEIVWKTKVKNFKGGNIEK